MNRFVLKNISILFFDKYFYKNKKSKLDIEDSVIVQNNLFYRCEGSTVFHLLE